MKRIKNYEASIKDKLRIIAKKEGKSHQLLLIRYFQERFLYRLSISNYKDFFCLKGAAFLYALFEEKSRMTKDIDFLGRKTPATLANLTTIFSEIAAITCEKDAVTFDATTIKAAEIVKDGKYQGVRLTINGFIGKTSQKLQIDVGFGDIITPNPIEMEYPTILDLPAPQLFSYNIETVIAEKFEAMISLSEVNTRMKDFYDVYYLLEFGDYDKIQLKQAIINTFKQRGTSLPKKHSIFTSAFVKDEQRFKLWHKLVAQNDFRYKSKI